MMTVFDEIRMERIRQIVDEGFDAEQDDGYDLCQLPRAAACYAVGYNDLYVESPIADSDPVQVWPWDERWFKPSDERRNLIKAAALIVAEIDRLDRIHGV